MSLRPQTIPPVPDNTATVARAAFPKGTAVLRLRDELGRNPILPIAHADALPVHAYGVVQVRTLLANSEGLVTVQGRRLLK